MSGPPEVEPKSAVQCKERIKMVQLNPVEKTQHCKSLHKPMLAQTLSMLGFAFIKGAKNSRRRRRRRAKRCVGDPKRKEKEKKEKEEEEESV
ncbi:hypothetical protein FNV43_RR06894 [Rhamnella rubrinervis]|uniref:Uncharacterized protein n=1 Tax=Rhamnella rubrinervis TaxID=2594499 RepID=A0A8K0HED5_9ROSA|nr:hypothetical protein FNV43_RR06894 [Rhamnella rubrinervis]